jgi:hypothetical protein
MLSYCVSLCSWFRVVMDGTILTIPWQRRHQQLPSVGHFRRPRRAIFNPLRQRGRMQIHQSAEIDVSIANMLHNQIIFFFLHQNQNIFFSNIGNQNIFLEKNHNTPLQVKWSFPNCIVNAILSTVIVYIPLIK